MLILSLKAPLVSVPGTKEEERFIQGKPAPYRITASVMIEKFAGIRSRSVSEFLYLNHTRNHKLSSVLSIAKFVQRLPRDPTNFAIGTLATIRAGQSHGFRKV
jgi:hypothetical protein